MSRGLHRGRRTLRRAGSESTAIRFRGNEPPESPVEANEDLSVYRPPRAETEDGRPHKMVLTALDRRHTLAVTGTSAGRSGQWTWTRHEGGGRAGGNWKREEQRHICAAGVSYPSPQAGNQGSGGAEGPFLFLARTEKLPFLLWHGGMLEAGTGTVYRGPGRASTGLSRLRIYRDRGKGPEACFLLGKIRCG